MAKRYTDEFRRDAVRMATTSGLTRPQLSSDLGVGLSTLNKWVQQHQHDDLMSGPHEDVEKENRRLRKEVRLLREEMSLDILGVQREYPSLCVWGSARTNLSLAIACTVSASLIWPCMASMRGSLNALRVMADGL